MTKNKFVTITLEGEGISFKREIDESVAAEVLGLCLHTVEGGVSPATARASVRSLNPQSKLLKESAVEYVKRFSPARNPDIILTFASYLKDVRGQGSFQSAEIKGLFRDAGEVMPANFSRDFKWVRKSGWIAEDDHSKGDYYITNTGLKVLKEGFPKEMLTRSKPKSTSRRKRTKTKGKDDA